MIHIADRHVALVERCSREARPLEYCAAMLGLVDDEAAVIKRIVRTRNADTRMHRFAIPDAEMRRCRALGDELQLALIALYHSHSNNPPSLSDADRVSLTQCPYHWVIGGFNSDDELELAGFEAETGRPISLTPTCDPYRTV
jgi:proteasome lid subunit RPN8/RPN11